MKRKTFEIRLNGDLLETRTAFNASNRAIEANIRAFCQKQNVRAELSRTETRRDEDGNGVFGERVWETSSGEFLVYTIERVN